MSKCERCQEKRANDLWSVWLSHGPKRLEMLQLCKACGLKLGFVLGNFVGAGKRKEDSA